MYIENLETTITKCSYWTFALCHISSSGHFRLVITTNTPNNPKVETVNYWIPLMMLFWDRLADRTSENNYSRNSPWGESFRDTALEIGKNSRKRGAISSWLMVNFRLDSGPSLSSPWHLTCHKYVSAMSCQLAYIPVPLVLYTIVRMESSVSGHQSGSHSFLVISWEEQPRSQMHWRRQNWPLLANRVTTETIISSTLPMRNLWQEEAGHLVKGHNQ